MIVLLPFGRGGGGTEILKIEITPTLLKVPSNAKPQPLKIEFGEQLSSGEISVQAAKIPHRFEVEAVLSADGQEVARGICDCLLEETQKVVLQPNDKAGAEITGQPLTINFTADSYMRSRPADTVAVKFDLYRGAAQTDIDNAGFITKGAGVATLGGDLNYQLEQEKLPGDKKYELKFTVRLGRGERAD